MINGLAYCSTDKITTVKSFIIKPGTIWVSSGAKIIKHFLFVNYEFLHEARVFARLSWKSWPGTNTLAYHENPKITDIKADIFACLLDLNLKQS